jgi:hypothetical protein
MKRAVIACLLTFVALSMTGCPIYPSDNVCHSHWDCAPGYSCDELSGACLPPATTCTRPADCTGKNETCSEVGSCEIGSCHVVGCVAGYTCAVFESTWTCIARSAGTGGSAGAGGAGGSSHAGGSSSLGGASSAGGAFGDTGGASATGGAAAAGGAPSDTGGASSSGGST